MNGSIRFTKTSWSESAAAATAGSSRAALLTTASVSLGVGELEEDAIEK